MTPTSKPLFGIVLALIHYNYTSYICLIAAEQIEHQHGSQGACICQGCIGNRDDSTKEKKVPLIYLPMNLVESASPFYESNPPRELLQSAGTPEGILP